MNRQYFKAPWGRSLRFMSVLGTVVLVVVPVLVLRAGALPMWAKMLAGAFAGSLFLVAALFTVRGYVLEGDALLVRRLLWFTRIPLRGLRNARVDPDALCGTLRIGGNGGLFSFSGWYRNRTLGTYRMWLTDEARVVVLELGDRSLVVSPEDPEAFVRALMDRERGASARGSA